MWPESSEQPTPLRTGLTTGSCATACTVAAVRYLFEQKRLSTVAIMLPRGQAVELPIHHVEALDTDSAIAATIKDAGDDPDVTHGSEVFVQLRLTREKAITFKAAAGVGTVTKAGLSLAIGEPAINPVPRQMITDHLQRYRAFYAYEGGFEVAVGVKNGAQIAQKTMNPRLGILGGLSILGTTGIVRPYSCAAYIASIRQGVDVACNNGLTHIAASTGSTSEAMVREHYQLSDMALIEMGDFAGAFLKHLRRNTQLTRLTLCAGFGKLTKLAAGHLDLHSRASSIDLHQLAQIARELGGDEQLAEQIAGCNTSMETLRLCQMQKLPLADTICQRAGAVMRRFIPKTITITVWAVDRKGLPVGSYADTPALLARCYGMTEIGDDE